MSTIGRRSIEARHVDFENELIHFPPSEAKGGLANRVIFLTEKAAEILDANIHRKEGPVFVNTMVGRGQRTQSVAGSSVSKRNLANQCAYAIRHSYATDGLKSGMDSLVLAQLNCLP